jgi:hypothetical protein
MGRMGEMSHPFSHSPILPFSHSPTLPLSHSPLLPISLSPLSPSPLRSCSQESLELSLPSFSHICSGRDRFVIKN